MTNKLPTKHMRVMLRDEYECNWHGVWPKGEFGEVVSIDTNIIGVKLDKHYDALNEWNNELQIDLDTARYNNWTLAEYFWRTWELRWSKSTPLGTRHRASISVAPTNTAMTKTSPRNSACGCVISASAGTR